MLRESVQALQQSLSYVHNTSSGLKPHELRAVAGLLVTKVRPWAPEAWIVFGSCLDRVWAEDATPA